jgi:hypothetical protein
MLPGVHVLHQFIRDHSFFQKHFENKTGKEFFNPLDIFGVYFWHGIAIAFPVPAGISDQFMHMRIPVGHTSKSLWYEDATGKDTFAIEGFMKKYCKRIPGTSAELWQKLPVVQETQPEHFRNAPHPVPVRYRSEKLFFEEDCKIQ